MSKDKDSAAPGVKGGVDVAPKRALAARGKETTASIADWAAATFGPAHEPAPVAARANEEMAELLRAATSGVTGDKLVQEAADVVIVLARLVHVQGADLWEAVERKMSINRKRSWKMDGTGHGYHINTKVEPWSNLP